MKRALLLLLALGLPPAVRADVESDFKVFFRTEISGRFAAEPASEQRAVMLRGFEKYDVPAAARWLMLEVLAKDPAADVLHEAVRVLGKYKRPETVAAMAEIWNKKLRKAWEARALALLAFGRIPGATAEGVLAKGLEDKDARVVSCACRAVGEGRRLALKEKLKKLARFHKHRAVRGAALTALGELGGDDVLPLLLQAFCSDKSDRVRYDAWLALRKAAIEPDLPCDPDAWREWWERQMTAVPEGEPNPWGTSFPRVAPGYALPGNFFGIPLLGDRIGFALDVSLDMDNPWEIDLAAERKKPREKRIPHMFSVKTRWDLVCAYVGQALEALPASTELCFAFFNHEVATYPEKPRFLKNRPRDRAKLLAHLKEVRRGGSTAMYEGLKAVWGFLTDGHPKTNFDKGVDTIVFVTDGQPRAGELENRPDRLAAEVWRIAVTRNIRFHCVGLHYHAYDLLKTMAKESGGLYVHAQQAGDTTEPQDLDFWPKKKKAFEEARRKKRTPGPVGG